MSIVSNYIDDLLAIQYDPTLMQARMNKLLQDVSSGAYQIVDPTNPFTFLAEASVVNACAAMEKDAINTRRQYQSCAQTQEELYLHMSDKDYVGRFALPATTTFNLVLPLEEIKAKMVYDPTTNSMKMVIPRNTYFTVSDTIFSMQYPVVINQQANGGLQVLYDTSVPSPLQTLSSNLVPKSIRNVGGRDYLTLILEVQQFKITSKTESLTQSKQFSKAYAFDDQFYYARVYNGNADGTWTEIRTTHTDQVYDIKTPTAVLRVLDNKLTVTIPLVYVSSGLISGKIRTDIYQTKGAMQLNLQDTGSEAFGVTWEAYDKNDETIFVAPIKTIRELIPYSDQFVSGGRAPLDFETLRDRVINRAFSTNKELPITNVQLETVLEDEGFELVRNVDVITNRIFLATRSMPDPTDIKLITAAAASMETISLKAEDAAHIGTVVDNGTSITIKSSTIYQNVNGVTNLLSDAQIQALVNMTPDQRAAAVTGNGYLYSPFHYVLDMSASEFKLRPYYLDAPEALSKSFVANNDTTQMQVTTDAYGLYTTANGFVLRITTLSSDGFRALTPDKAHVQLAFVPAYERDRAYLNGTYAGRTPAGEFIFDFDLSSTYNIDAQNYLELTKFLMYTEEPRIVGANLLTSFDIIYSTSAVLDLTWQPNVIDAILGRFVLPNQIAGVTHETMQMRFGYSLDTLWARGRTSVDSVKYQTYQTDVPMLYAQDIYQTDPTTGSIVTIVNGSPTFTILHHKNDPVLDNLGAPVFQYRKGDVVLDVSGNPIPLGPRSLLRQIDIMTIEGVYWFANDTSATNYRGELVKNLLNWLTVDLEGMTGSLLDKTQVFFYPKATQGIVNANIGGGIITNVPAAQSFTITLEVPKEVLSDENLKKQLTRSTIELLSTVLTDKTVSNSNIVSALKTMYGSYVRSFKVEGLGGTLNLSTLTVLDDVNRCSLRKRLEAQPDGSLIVSEDVTMKWEDADKTA